MNIQSRTVTNRRPPRRRQGASRPRPGTLYLILYLLLMAATAFGIANYRIDLNRRMADLRRATNSLKAEMNELDLDIQRLKLERERLSRWDNISTQIARHNLKLRQSEPAQTRFLAVRRGGKTPHNASGAASLREREAEARLSLNRQ